MHQSGRQAPHGAGRADCRIRLVSNRLHREPRHGVWHGDRQQTAAEPLPHRGRRFHHLVYRQEDTTRAPAGLHPHPDDDLCRRRGQHLRLPVLRTDLHGVSALWRARPVGGLGRGLCAHAHGTRGGHVLLPALPWHLPHMDAVLVENRLSSSRPCSTSPTLVSVSVWRCF